MEVYAFVCLFTLVFLLRSAEKENTDVFEGFKGICLVVGLSLIWPIVLAFYLAEHIADE